MRNNSKFYRSNFRAFSVCCCCFCLFSHLLLKTFPQILRNWHWEVKRDGSFGFSILLTNKVCHSEIILELGWYCQSLLNPVKVLNWVIGSGNSSSCAGDDQQVLFRKWDCTLNLALPLWYMKNLFPKNNKGNV